MRILCLFLRYGTTRYAEAVPALRNWYARTLPGCDFHLWIIDNSLPDDAELSTLDGIVPVVPGDNTHGEFSGWERFLREHQSMLADYDLVHFVTSAFLQNYSRYLQQVTLAALEMTASNTVCLGHIDFYDLPIRIEVESSDHWVRTCFFFLAPRTLNLVKRWVRCHEQSLVFAPDGEFWPDGFVDAEYQRRLTEWLSGKPQQGVAYHTPRSERDEFMRKAVAIINEHGFAVTLRTAGISLVDIGFGFLACPSAYPSRLVPRTPVHRQLELRYDYLNAFPCKESHRFNGDDVLLPEANSAFYKWGSILEFGTGKPHNTHLAGGWSAPEPGRCWTDGRHACVRFLVEPSPTPIHVNILVDPFCPPSIQGQIVNVSCCSVPLGSFGLNQDQTLSFALPFFVHLGLRVIILHFELPNAVSPAAAGIGGDTRSLGISIRAACLTPLM